MHGITKRISGLTLWPAVALSVVTSGALLTVVYAIALICKSRIGL